MLHQFSRITEYGHKGNTFQMTIRTLVQGINFVCESPMVGRVAGGGVSFKCIFYSCFFLVFYSCFLLNKTFVSNVFKGSPILFLGVRNRRPHQILRQDV